MAETAVSDGDEPQKPTNRILPDLSNVNEFYLARYTGPGTGTNGRLYDKEGVLFTLDAYNNRHFAPIPTVAEKKAWRARVRANIVRREEVLKSIPAMLKERARVRVYDHIFGWILEDPERGDSRLGTYPAKPKDDVNLFL